jgi:hypothetical protein
MQTFNTTPMIFLVYFTPVKKRGLIWQSDLGMLKEVG